MKIAYITAQTPWGRGETFILEEMLEVKRQGIDLLIIPRNPPKEIFHKESEGLLEDSLWLPLINFKMVINFLKVLFTTVSLWKILENRNFKGATDGHRKNTEKDVSVKFSEILWLILWVLIKHSRNPWIFIKNLIVFPKGVFIANIIQKEKIQHIHAHWGSTTATMAYVISQITGIPWSFTLHRWDIKENNMLKEKVKSAGFVRCISEHGKNELFEIIGNEYKEKIQVVHMGVKIPSGVSEFRKDKKNFTIVTPANLLGVKGHKYLIDACSILVKQDIKNFECIFYGAGPLKTELENLVKEKKLTDYIKMPGAIPHEKLIEMYKNQDIDAVVLPSITTSDGEHEGIPVSLMEAMAYKIPVISTDTGGIPELLSNDAGIIVEEKSPEQLVKAILKVMKEENFKNALTENGFQKVKEKFDIQKNVKTLLELIQ